MKTLLVILFALSTGSVQAEILDEERLAKALTELPQIRLDLDTARQLVSITTAATADTDLDPVTLLAQMYFESRFVPASTSRLIDGKRQTGAWHSRKEPAGWAGTLYCGISQTVALTWKRCLALREPEAAIEAQVRELSNWMVRAKGDTTKALGGYGCGNAGLTNGCRNYAGRVLRLVRKLRLLVIPMS